MATIQLPEEILEEISREFKIPLHVVDRIVRHQFGFVKQCMANEEACRLHKLGVFIPKAQYNAANRVHSDKGPVQGSDGEG